MHVPPILRPILAALIGIALCANALADGPDQPIPSFYQEPGLSPNRGYANQHPSEHIDPFTGKLQWHFVDLFIPGNGGFDLKVQRSYSSQSEAFPTPTNAGVGWTMHFGRVLRTSLSSICDTTLFTKAGRNPVLELPDGSRQMLYIGADSASFISASYWKATCAAGGMGLVIYSPDGTRYDMDVAGKVEGSATHPVNTYYPSKITDRNGNSMTLTYASLPLTTGVSTVTTSDGRAVTFTYNPAGNVQTVSDGTRVWTYTYQASATMLAQYYLTEVKRPDTQKWVYEYYDTRVGTPGEGSMKSATYPTGGKINYTYNFAVFSPSIDIPRSTVVATKVADGATWTFAYTPATIPLPIGRTSWTGSDMVPANLDITDIDGPDGHSKYYHLGYSTVSSGIVFMIGALFQVDRGLLESEGRSWMPQSVSYQMNGRPGDTLVFDNSTATPLLTGRDIVRDGQHTAVTYDTFDEYGNPGVITETGTATKKTSVSYFVSPSKWILHLKKDESSQIVSASPVESVGTITRTFDAKGNLLTENRYGVTTQFTYTAAGDIASRTDALGRITTYANYKRGIPQLETYPDGSTVSRVVSNAGDIVSQTDGEGAVTTYTYDALNRLTGIVHPRGNPVTVTWARNNRTVVRGGYTERLTFDGFGREVKSEHLGAAVPLYQTTAYDAAGRVTFKSYPNSTAGTSFTYDTLGRVLTATHPAAGTGSSSRSMRYALNTVAVTNERGLVSKTTYRLFSDPNQQEVMQIDAPDASASVVLKRNGLGQVTAVTQNGKTRSFGYDTRYFLTTKTEPETGVTTYGRDAVGNMTSRQVGASPVTTFSYDALNRLTSTAYPGMTAITKTYYKDSKLKSIDTGLAVQNYVYDLNKNLSSESLTIATQVFTTSYAYDGNDALNTLTYGSGKTVTYSPDALGRPTKAAPYITAVTHHPTGEVASLLYANGVTTNVALNARMWPSSLSVTGGAPIFNMSYGYDESGNVVAITDAVDDSYNRSMSYDAIDRVVSVNGSWGSGTFSYDGRGNITNQKLGSFNLGYVFDPASERLLGTTGSRVLNFTYDVYGNVTSNGATAFSYNNASNMTCAKCGRPDQSVYDYDGSDMRVRSQKSGVTTYYVYGLGGKLLWERTPYSNLKEYVYLGGKQVATRQQAISGP